MHACSSFGEMHVCEWTQPGCVSCDGLAHAAATMGHDLPPYVYGPVRVKIFTFQTPFREWTYSQTQSFKLRSESGPTLRLRVSNSVQRVELLSDSEFLHFKLRSESGPTLRLRVITFQTPFREWTYSQTQSFKLRSESGPTLRLRVFTFQTPFREWTYSQTQSVYISNSVQRVDQLSDSECLHFKLRSESGPTLRLRVFTFQTPFREWTNSQTQSVYISNSVQRVDLLSDSEFLHFKLRSESGPTLRLRVITFQTPFREWTYSQTQSYYISNSVQRVYLLSDSECLHFKLRSESGPTLRLRVFTFQTPFREWT